MPKAKPAKGRTMAQPVFLTGTMSPAKCDRCGTVWHSSQRRLGDRCGVGRRGCKGTCR